MTVNNTIKTMMVKITKGTSHLEQLKGQALAINVWKGQGPGAVVEKEGGKLKISSVMGNQRL